MELMDEEEERSPQHVMGKRSGAAGVNKRFTVDFNGMQVKNQSNVKTILYTNGWV